VKEDCAAPDAALQETPPHTTHDTLLFAFVVLRIARPASLLLLTL
jgi:hypothetical protein